MSNAKTQRFEVHWLGRYVAALAAVGAGFLLRLGLSALVGEGLPTYITFFPVIMAVALLGGFGPGLVATLATALAVDYWILPPAHAFGIANLVDAVGLAFFAGMGVFMSAVAELYRRARQKAVAHDTPLLWQEGSELPRQPLGETALLFGGLVLASAILGTMGWQSYRNLTATVQADRLVSRTYIVDEELEHLFSALRDMEASARGYLIMGEEDYLRPYNVARRIMAGELASLKLLTGDNAGQVQRLAGVEALVDTKLAELKEVIEVRRSQGFEAAHTLMATGKGQALTEEIQRRMTAVQEEETELLHARISARDADLHKTLVLLLAGGVLSFLLLTTVFLFLMQENSRRRRAEAELLRRRDDLQKTVTARTTDLSQANESLRDLNAQLQRRVAELQAANKEVQDSRRAALSLAEDALEARKEAERVTIELQKTNESLGASRRAALNLMDDAVQARKQAEQASAELRQSEERYRGLVELSPEGLFVNHNDRIVLVNPAALLLFGASSSEQLLGKSPFEVFHPDCHAQIRERIGRLLAGQRVPVLEEKIVRLDGVAVDVEMVVAPVTDQGERAIQVLLRDITERKRAEAALQRTTEDLKRSNRDLEQFAYVASHDLQEPLRAVGGYVKLLQLRFPDKLDAKAQSYIAGAFDGATRMERLISDLLAFSRVATRGDPFLPADLADALGQALRNLEAGIDSAQATVAHDPLPTLAVDAGQIRQLFQNLVGNALKFHGEQPPQIHIGAQKQDGRWVFSVRDNGIGIEPQYYEKIFHIFQRLHTRKDYPGTGIGLAICKKIVERHGGTIWVESQPGQGSTFYFSLPETAGG